MERDDQTGFNWSMVPVCTHGNGLPFQWKKSEELLISTDYCNECAQGEF